MDENNIAQNIKRVQEKISTYAAKYNRNMNDITLIGVSKYASVNDTKEAVKAGLKDLGENRVSQLIERREILSSDNLNPNWHLIGTLQRKKVRLIIGKCSLIHSVDSIDLLDEISKRSTEIGITSPILLQVNVSYESTKHGFDPSNVDNLIEQLTLYPGVDLRGIMTMAPLTDDEQIINNVFSKTQELFFKIKSNLDKSLFESNVDKSLIETHVDKSSFDILSMGMSNDYHIAIANGATHLRIGTAIFGPRIY